MEGLIFEILWYYMDIFIFAFFSIKTLALRRLETKENNAVAGVSSRTHGLISSFYRHKIRFRC